MPIYAMHMRLHGGQLVPDPEPTNHVSDGAALEEARRAALEIAGDALRAQQRPVVEGFEVRRDDGTEVGTISVQAAAAAQLG